MKQTYICKCGRRFEKDTTADTTGYRLGADFGPEHECFGCPFVVSIKEWDSAPKIIDYECRASKKINYRTTADLPRSRDGFHVGRIHTLDLDFAKEIWTFSRALPGLEDSSKEMDKRGACYGADGRYCLSLYFSKTKAGVASLVAISDKFFGGGSERSELSEEQERQQVIAKIEKSKRDASNSGTVQLSQGKPDAVTEKTIDQITLEINFYKAQTAQNILEIGKRLIAAKQQLPYGEWLPWLRDKVEFSERSARNFMEIAQTFSNRQPVADLPYTKLLALLQVPEQDREEFIQETHLIDGKEKSISEMSKRELKRAIKERDEALEEKEKFREKYKNAEIKAEESKKSMDSVKSSRESYLRKITELEQQVRELQSRPVEVAVQEVSESDRERLRREGASSARREYEQKLRDAQRELEEVKSQAWQQSGLEQREIVASAACFRDSVDNGLENLLLILRLSPANTIDAVVRECVAHLKEKIEDLEDSAALIHNEALMDEDFELPPADGLET